MVAGMWRGVQVRPVLFFMIVLLPVEGVTEVSLFVDSPIHHVVVAVLELVTVLVVVVVVVDRVVLWFAHRRCGLEGTCTII